MIRLSTKIVAVLALLTIFAVESYAERPGWPLDGRIDLSSGFGDFRARRFHVGIDLRTGGATGKPVMSPVDGYLWRVRASYDGYGKVVYIRGNDGHIYVLAHLDSFAPPIEAYVTRHQLAAQRYYIDERPPADSIQIAKGEVIGRSGQTGAGAPHLHFEQRTPNNLPINPLKNGFELQDKVRPTFERLGVRLTDGRSIFEDGEPKRFFDVDRRRDGKYGLNQVPYLNRPFGLLVDCYDQMRPGSMRQSIYGLSLTVDGREVYEIVLDSIDFADGVLSALEFDYLEAVDKKTRVRRLFKRIGNGFGNSRAQNGNDGIVGSDGALAFGKHEARITGVDAFGNTSTLTFDFVWGPANDVCPVDSSQVSGDTLVLVYYTPGEFYRTLDITKVRLEKNKHTDWFPVDSVYINDGDNGQKVMSIRGRGNRHAVMRMVLETADGAVIKDEPFHGIMPGNAKRVDLVHEVHPAGLLVRAQTVATRAIEPRLELYYRDTLLGREYPRRYVNMREYVFMIPPESRYRRIDKIAFGLSEDTTAPAGFFSEVDIRLIGDTDEEVYTVDSLFVVRARSDQFFTPQFVELQARPVYVRRGNLNSGLYDLQPTAFVTRGNFDLELTIKAVNRINNKSGICWYDPDEDEWVWLTDNVWDSTSQTLTASAQGGGRYGAVLDLNAPTISHLNIRQGKTYFNPRQTIRFNLSDDLSGIADDRSIVILLDRQWMIPEYDPESEVCKTTPVEPLSDGNHHLEIQVTDRAGNTVSEFRQFFVKDRKTP